jgi:hypothetical protein
MVWLDRLRPGLSGSDADDIEDIAHKNLAITNLACAGRRLDGFQGSWREVISNNQFDLDLRQKINNVFGPAVKFRVAFLAAISLGLQHGHALYADFLKGFLHFVELKGFDDGFDFFHA